jgi:GDP-4-dehydro-6-deoxy-D-mannose reductase
MTRQSGQRVLITGSQGFVGRYLTAELLANDPTLTIVGAGRSIRADDTFTHCIHLPSGAVRAPMPQTLRLAINTDRYIYHRLDIGDTAAVADLLRQLQPAVIVHAAASLRDDPFETLLRNNVAATESLLTAVGVAGFRKAPRVILGSTGGLYGMPVPESLPIQEDASCSPIDLYSVTKLAAEHASRIVCARHGIPMMSARLFNVIGPGQDERHLCVSLARQFAAIRQGIQPRCIQVGSLETTRDFVDVRDAARAIRLIMEHGRSGETYNVASGIETPVQRVYDELALLADLRDAVRISRSPARAADIPRHFADISKLRSLGFTPYHTLRESLADIFTYYTELVARISTENV